MLKLWNNVVLFYSFLFLLFYKINKPLVSVCDKAVLCHYNAQHSLQWVIALVNLIKL